jgi:hypothetical protein
LKLITHSPLRIGNASFQCLHHITYQLTWQSSEHYKCACFELCPPLQCLPQIHLRRNVQAKKWNGKLLWIRIICQCDPICVDGWLACYHQSNPTVIKITRWMLSHLSTRMGRSTHTSIIYIYKKKNKKKNKHLRAFILKTEKWSSFICLWEDEEHWRQNRFTMRLWSWPRMGLMSIVNLKFLYLIQKRTM